ncbi:MAG: WecB/TagA/CpsF family glycosyltransferase [Candidatus Doudnabacteria bacterium]|nr:WecB/TagA/CpsF family glycosyltransferase [Candidatus Doudnabacteria bacterium]
MKIDIAKVLVDNLTKEETIRRLDEYIQTGKPHYVVTTYSEFVVFANRDQRYLEVLNKADLSIPDGIGVVWAGNFLSGKKLIPEKVSGSRLIWDVTRLAADKNYSIALVGGENSVAAQAANKLRAAYPNLKVNLSLSDNTFDEQLVRQIANSNSDILCIAYAPPKQEIWIAKNLSKLNVKVAIGLGGTFDYLAGKRKYAPDWMVGLGLEWLFRLITQPWRIKRMWNAIVVFSFIILKYKFHGKS